MALLIVLLIVAAILVATWRLTTFKADATREAGKAESAAQRVVDSLKPPSA